MKTRVVNAANGAESIPQPHWLPSVKNPLILYELNEVPWRVVDWYIERRPSCSLSRILASATTFTTLTRDDGELHPWCTWPSLHRGVYNTTHNIRFINQDKRCAAQYPPVWETAAVAGRKVGVFGSLQSYPIPSYPQYAFYVPDTFSPSSETHPSRYTAFQRFNLRQTRADSAVARAVSLDGSVLSDLVAMVRIGVKPRTMGALAGQLIREKLSSLHRVRRPLLQPVLSFDVFMDALTRYRPEFCTFFTNHVASTMHRYWKHAFPEDFQFTISSRRDAFLAQNLLTAMDIADEQLEILRRYVDQEEGQLVIASSMGQEAIDRGEYAGELRLVDVRALAELIGFHKALKNLLAMQPDFNFEFDCVQDCLEFESKAKGLVDAAGASIWYNCTAIGNTLNLALRSAPDILRNEMLYRVCDDGSQEAVTLKRAGMERIVRDDGTAYHQPRGIFIWHDPRMPQGGVRQDMELTDVRRLLLHALGIEA